MKILLIFPGHTQNTPTLPFSILVLASYLRKRNIAVDLLDTRVADYKTINYNDYLLIGVSAKSGEQLSSGIEVCRWIRKHSRTQIVFGGPHATFFPEQTCKSPLVDYVVKGEGEVTLYELACALQTGGEISDIRGLVYQRGGKVCVNPERPFMNMGDLEIPAYDLVDLNLYQDSFRYFTIETSRGCPYRCSFCYVHDFHHRRWRTKSVPQSIGEIKQVHEQYGIEKFFICDDNFFVKKERVLAFLQAILDAGLQIEIFAQARADYFAGYTDSELGLIAKAGVKFVAMGAESGSQRILDGIKKDITTEDILRSAGNCIRFNMIPIYSFMIGIPGEKESDLSKTIDMYFKLKAISPCVEINGFYIFTPYPGTPVYHETIKQGYKPHTTLEEWANWNFSDFSNLPWLSRQDKQRLPVLSKIIMFLFIWDRFLSYGSDFKRKKLGAWHLNLIWDTASRLLLLDARIRLKKRWFRYGYEWLLFGKIAARFKVT